MGRDSTAVVFRLQAEKDRLKRDLDKAKGHLSRYKQQSSNILSGIGKQMVGAFAIGTVASFGLEISKLAGEAKGVKAAFDRLKDSAKVLEEMREATGGTVSELELMKRTTQAANFGISLQALPKLMEFATLRAQQTGQSVDYLVDSIVTGIGRKSPLILDNLGISAVALKEKLGGVSIAAADVGLVADAVGKIAEENLQDMADFSENASTKVQRLDATWENFKVTLGTVTNESGVLNRSLDHTTTLLGLFNGDSSFKDLVRTSGGVLKNLSGASKTLGFLGAFLGAVTKETSDVNAQMGPFAQNLMKLPPLTRKSAETLRYLNDQLKNLNDQKLDAADSEIADYDRRIDSLKKKIDEFGQTKKSFLAPIDNVAAKGQSNLLGGFVMPAPQIDTEGWNEYRRAFKGQMSQLEMDMQNQVAVLNSIVDGAVANAISSTVEMIASGNLKNVFSGLMGIIGEGLVDMGKALVSMGVMLKAFASAPPGAKIAAGIAAIALGSLFKGAAGRMASNVGSAGGGGANGYSSGLSSQSFSIPSTITLVAKGKDLVGVMRTNNRNQAL
ncbi:MAG: hypothetical protein ACRBG0_19330 [Lewinella sp.]|uniref:hypothetical protein n=1 Tax=Lewinella sp. TaxID=2004506 RepID=UPI003D6B7006